MNRRARTAPFPPGAVLVLTRRDVGRLLPQEDCIAAVEEALRLFGERRVEPPAVLSTHVPGGGFHVKAAVLPCEGRLFYVAKTNANFPENAGRYHLPTIQGALLLFDAECGRLLAVMDSIEITSLRTAAATAVAAKYLARRDSAVVTVIGCGVQGGAQIAALRRVLPVRTVYACDRDPARSRALADAVAGSTAIDARAVDDFADAARQSDVVVTCTTATAPFLEITIFDSTGMALEDAAAACAVYKRAQTTSRLRRVRLAS